MSIKHQQLFVGLLDKDTWTTEKLTAYLDKHAIVNDEQYVIDCHFMTYSEQEFCGKCFAFVTFNDSACVDRCMNKREQFHNDYGITVKRLLPDSINKCERLMSSTDIVVRIIVPDPLFTEKNIRSYFEKYGNIAELKMLEEDDVAGICFIRFEDCDSSDRILLDEPHYLNEQQLSIHKYFTPEWICKLSQYRFIDPENAHRIERWYPIFRNLSDFISPLKTLHKTQLALTKHSLNRRVTKNKTILSKTEEDLSTLKKKYHNMKRDLLILDQLNQQLRKKIEELRSKNVMIENDFKTKIEVEMQKYQLLQTFITNSSPNT